MRNPETLGEEERRDERGQRKSNVREVMYRSKRTRPHSPVLFHRLSVADIHHIVCTFHSSSPSAWKHAMSYDPLPLPFILFVIIARYAFASSWFSVTLRQWADTLNISERRITLRRFSYMLIKKRWSYLKYEGLLW